MANSNLRNRLEELTRERLRLTAEIREIETNLFIEDSQDIIRDLRAVADKYQGRFTSARQVAVIMKSVMREFRMHLMAGVMSARYAERAAQAEHRARTRQAKVKSAGDFTFLEN